MKNNLLTFDLGLMGKYLHRLNSFTAICIVCIATTLVLFPTLTNGWLDWDDKVNVLDNQLVRVLSWERIKLIFETPEINGLYMPLPIISWALNYKIGGLDPFGYHLVNLALHLGISCLVFFIIKQLTGHIWTAFLTALLFGIHPMHVEPVAWITGRRDLVYSIFLVGSMWFWINYNDKRKGRLPQYLLALLFFLASLLSKGVAVVLPVFLLLIDSYQGRTDFKRMLLEKSPFIALSMLFGIFAIYTQSQTSALNEVTDVPYHLSGITASYSLTLYLFQSVIPFQIGGFHPYPPNSAGIPWYMMASVIIPIALASILILFWKNKNILFGIGLTLVGFLPVIQFLPVGDGLVADRYAYMPYLGLFFLYSLLIVWVYERFYAYSFARSGLTISVLVYLGWLGYTANAATHIWESPETLWTNVIKQHPHNEKGFINRGRYRMEKGQLQLAKRDYDIAVKIAPHLPVMHQELGLYYQTVGSYPDAEKEFSTALHLDSMYHPARLNLGINHMRLKEFDQAIETFKTLEQLDSNNILVHLNLGVIYEGENDFGMANSEYSKAIEKRPEDFRGYQYRGVVSARLGKYQDASEDIDKWVSLSPRDGKGYLWKSRISFLLGQFDRAYSSALYAKQMGEIVDSSYLELINDSSTTSN